MEVSKEKSNLISIERHVLTIPGHHACEVVSWRNPNHEIKGRILYVPGIPGDTLEEFGRIGSQWISGNKGWEVRGVIHSGVICNQKNSKLTVGNEFRDGEVINGITASIRGGKIGEDGVTADDWVWDVKTAIIQAQSEGLPLTVVGHSFGGLLALTAISELVEEGKINDEFSSQIRFIAVSSPFYKKESLPDRKPLVGLDTAQPFTFYRDMESVDVMAEYDSRIPMASFEAYKRIWRYLKDSNLIKINRNEEEFNNSFIGLVNNFGEKVSVLGKTSINIITLFPKQDRWVSARSGKDLQEMIGKPVLVESFDIPSSSTQSMVSVNAHNEVKEWAQAVYKCL